MTSPHDAMAMNLRDAMDELRRVTAERDALRKAAQEFCEKVDRGEARSVRSYAAFKAALALGEPS